MTTSFCHVRALVSEDTAGWHSAYDAVARERRFLGLLEAPSQEVLQREVASAVAQGHPFFVAESAGSVVGWCSALPYNQDGFRHCAPLQMGVMGPWRGQGWGARLLEQTLSAARVQGLVRIDLEVYADNHAALRLYERFGFQLECVKRKQRFLDGLYTDVAHLGLLLDTAGVS